MDLVLNKTRAAEAEPRSRRWERTATQIAAIRLRGLSPDDADKIVESHSRALDGRLAEIFASGAYEMVGAAFNEFDTGLLAAAKAEFERQRQRQSNGITENLDLLDARMWRGRQERVLDLFISELKPGEKLLEVHWWRLVTTLRTRTYHELRAACRTVTETNDVYFEKNFDSDATRHAAEAAERERANPPAPQYGRNLDFPNGVRPGR